MDRRFYAIVMGIGPGIGSALALYFAKFYSVVLISRNLSSFEPVIADIKANGGHAIGITADASDPVSMDAAFGRIERELSDAKLALATYNVRGPFARKPFLELKLENLQANVAAEAGGLFYFAQKTIPLLLDSVTSSPYPPSLLVTGATASLRGSALFSTVAAGKFAQRAVAQSLAREFGPQGVHVALAIIDGGVDVPWAKNILVNGGVEDGKLKPDAIANSLWHLHTQHRSSWTLELDLRPYVEKF
ncbi:hypothetical protein V8C35DRAFT_333552 [Trichoderma chlorosporum]